MLASCGRGDQTPPPGAAAPFAHGVASGDPLADRVILWTRVTSPDGRAVDAAWTVARDAELTDVVAQGVARADPDRDWTAKVDVTELEPGTEYFYAFDALDARSPVGRTRTLPQGPTERCEIAVVSCANYPAGWFNVYRDIADRGEADFVVQLGDYFYEYGPGEYATEWGASHGRIPDPPHETVNLRDYRTRYAQYRADADLQDAHAAAPWIAIWDDHESANNSFATGADNHQPDEGEWSARKTAAIRAFFEWMPIREPEPGRAREAIWRAFEIGDLATLIMLETRLTARSREIFWDEAPIPPDADPDDPANHEALEGFMADVVGAPEREMLGAGQLGFIAEALARSKAAGKPWQVLGNQVMMARVFAPNYVEELPGWLKWVVRRQYPNEYKLLQFSRFRVPLSLDQWDGFPAERERLYAAARDADAQLLTLTGDSHCFWMNRLADGQGEVRGVEIGTSSVTSPSEFNQVAAPGVNFGALTEAANDEVLHHNAYDRGYVALTLTRDAATAELRRVNTIERRNFRTEPYARWRIAPNAEGALEAVEE